MNVVERLDSIRLDKDKHNNVTINTIVQMCVIGGSRNFKRDVAMKDLGIQPSDLTKTG